MTKDDLVSKNTTLKMAIEALEFFQQHSEFWKDTADEAINACKEALEQPAQEIVRKVFDIDNFHPSVLDKIKFTSPHQWQGLTDDEIDSLFAKDGLDSKGKNLQQLTIEFTHAIEQALRNKNT